MAENSKNHASGLTIWICGAIVLAIALALVAPRIAVGFHVGGEIFLRMLQMVVVPLVMASVMSGILGLGDVDDEDDDEHQHHHAHRKDEGGGEKLQRLNGEFREPIHRGLSLCRSTATPSPGA